MSTWFSKPATGTFGSSCETQDRPRASTLHAQQASIFLGHDPGLPRYHPGFSPPHLQDFFVFPGPRPSIGHHAPNAQTPCPLRWRRCAGSTPAPVAPAHPPIVNCGPSPGRPRPTQICASIPIIFAFRPWSGRAVVSPPVLIFHGTLPNALAAPPQTFSPYYQNRLIFARLGSLGDEIPPQGPLDLCAGHGGRCFPFFHPTGKSRSVPSLCRFAGSSRFMWGLGGRGTREK